MIVVLHKMECGSALWSDPIRPQLTEPFSSLPDYRTREKFQTQGIENTVRKKIFFLSLFLSFIHSFKLCLLFSLFLIFLIY